MLSLHHLGLSILVLCLTFATPSLGKRARKSVDNYEPDALASQNDPLLLSLNSSEPQARRNFVPPGFLDGNTTLEDYASASPLACGARVTLSPGTMVRIQSPGFPSPSARGTRCAWNFDLPTNARVEVICDFFNVPCAWRNSLQQRIPGVGLRALCNVPANQVVRNQVLGTITNQGSPVVMEFTYIIPRFFARPGQGLSCRLNAAGSSGPTATTVAPTFTTTTEASATPDPTNGQCGIKGAQRIVGGAYASENEWPWATALIISTPSGAFFCGGSIISDRTILTAAHCVENTVNFVDAYVGCTNRNSADCQIIRVPRSGVLRHPSYQNVVGGRDVALLKLPGPLTFSRGVAPVCLPTSFNTNFSPNQMWVTGWGRTTDGGQTSSLLKEATLSNTPLQTCRNTYGSQLASDILCTLRGSGATCQGDSGSGVTNERGNQYYVDGVVSFGGPVCGNFPSGNAEVFENIGWIRSNM